MSKETKEGIYKGIIEKDENGNYFCGPYLLDYKLTVAKFKLGDTVLINTVINNRSDISLTQYPKKSMKFTLIVDEVIEEDNEENKVDNKEDDTIQE